MVTCGDHARPDTRPVVSCIPSVYSNPHARSRERPRAPQDQNGIPMSTNVAIPPLGESVSEAVLLRWLKNDGEPVAEGDSLAELETEKAKGDFPAQHRRGLRQLKSPGDTVQVGETVARIDPAGAGASAA